MLGPEKSSTYSTLYVTIVFWPAASHLATPPSPHHGGTLDNLLGCDSSKIAAARKLPEDGKMSV